MSQLFNFKQFSVEQDNCAMKINTDAVLLGALIDQGDSKTILDIGAGTGVITLMLAQRYSGATIDAVEIDQLAAATAKQNFENSPFAGRLKIFPVSFQVYFGMNDTKYDLIISNPPFFLNSLKNPDGPKTIARHTDGSFFEKLFASSAQALNENGKLAIIIPTEISNQLILEAAKNELQLYQDIQIKSFSYSTPHRHILIFGCYEQEIETPSFVIYKAQKEYSEQYINALKNFFTIF